MNQHKSGYAFDVFTFCISNPQQPVDPVKSHIKQIINLENDTAFGDK